MDCHLWIETMQSSWLQDTKTHEQQYLVTIDYSYFLDKRVIREYRSWLDSNSVSDTIYILTNKRMKILSRNYSTYC